MLLYIFSIAGISLFLFIVIVALFTEDHHPASRKFLVHSLAFILLAGSFYSLINLRIKYNLMGLFEENLRYVAYDIRDAILDDTIVYSVNPFALSWDYTNPDACVETYANLPTSSGGMSGYKWYRQYYNFSDNWGPADIFAIRDLWEHYEIEQGRCAAPKRQL